MPRRVGVVRTRNVNLERRLCSLQRAVSGAATALVERDALLLRLYDQGYEQRELADLLNREVTKAGGTPLSEDAVQKAIRKQTQRDTAVAS
jgi:hypothetical protein